MTYADMEFRRIEIEWVARTGAAHFIEQVLPHHQASLIRQLGSSSYKARTLAREELARMGERAYDALCWGLRSRDPEVRSSCVKLVNRFFDCPECSGTVYCRYCAGEPVDADFVCHKCQRQQACQACLGTKDARWRRAYPGDPCPPIPVNIWEK